MKKTIMLIACAALLFPASVSAKAKKKKVATPLPTI